MEKRVERHYFQDGTFSLKTYNFKGGIEYEATFDSDSLLHGKFIAYHSNGRKKVEKNFEKGKKEGSTCGYYKNGSIEYKGWYHDDKKNDIWVWYNENGKKVLIESYLNANLFGGQVNYNESGHIKNYTLYQQEGMCGKLTLYDRSPKIEGSLYYLWYNKDTLKENEIFSSIFFVGVPPSWESFLTLKLTGADVNNPLQDQCSLTKSRTHNMDKYVLECSMFPPGSYFINYHVEIKDVNGKVVYADSLSHQFFFN